MQTLHLYVIQWDTDGETIDSLPQYVTTHITPDAEEDLADQLSDEYGWCIFSLHSHGEIPFIPQSLTA